MKKIILTVLVVSVLLLSVGSVLAVGNGWRGYNEHGANIFVGTGEQWAMERFVMNHEDAEAYMGAYAHDLLVMKWSEAWQMAVFGPDGIRENGDESPWTTDAWEDNEWNGMVPGGSGETEHFKTVWVGDCVSDPSLVPEGGYCIWGEFAVLQDFYGPGVPDVLAHAIPNGYGA